MALDARTVAVTLAQNLSLFLLVFLGICSVGMTYDDYKMVDDGLTDCSKSVNSQGGRIKAYDHGSATPDFGCQFTVTSADADQRFYIRFDKFDVKSGMPDCSDHKLEIYDGDSTAADRLTGANGLCQSGDDTSLPAPVFSTGNSVTFYLYDNAADNSADFRLVYSAYKDSSDGMCYKCQNATDICIDPTLKCDGLGNCPKASDESISKGGGCEDTSIGFLTVWLIVFCVVIGVIVLVLIIACVCFVWFFCRRKTRPKAATATGYKSTADTPAAYTPQPGQQGNLRSAPGDGDNVGYDAENQEVVVPQKAE